MPHDMAKNIKMHIPLKKYFKEIKEEEKGCGILA